VSNADLEIGKTSESSEQLGLARFVQLGPRQQHGDVRHFSDYNKYVSTIYTPTKLKKEKRYKKENIAFFRKVPPKSLDFRSRDIS
jgi:hypothetical protein